MSGLSRRSFLGKGSLMAAAAGLVATAPTAVTGLIAGAGAGATTGAAQAEADLSELGAVLDGPVVAHIRDLASGEIGIFTGTREVILKSPNLAAQLLKAIK